MKDQVSIRKFEILCIAETVFEVIRCSSEGMSTAYLIAKQGNVQRGEMHHVFIGPNCLC